MDPNKPNEGEKLYAGKFKTVEDLEAGYKNSAVVYDENATLKKQLDDLRTIPADYQNPSDVQIDSQRLTDIQARAREAGMTQAQYEKFIRGDKERIEKSKQGYETAKKDLGEQTLNILTDYVSKHYPKELQDGVMRTLIQNKEARQSALNHRDQLLNNQVPGVGRVTPPSYNVTDEDIRKAYAQKEKTRNSKDIARYLNLIAAQSEQAKAS